MVVLCMHYVAKGIIHVSKLENQSEFGLKDLSFVKVV